MPDSVMHGTLGKPSNWHGSPLPAPDPASIAVTFPEMLASLAAMHGQRTAIIFAEQRVSYAGLAEQAGALAWAIRNSGTGDGPVALLLPCGPLYIAAWFACAAAGRQMLMVECSNPALRNAALLRQAGATLVLHDGGAAAAEALGGRTGLKLTGLLAPRELPAGGLGPAEPAFLFATSGSTGEPKLIAYAQEGMQAKLQCSARTLGVAAGEIAMIAGSQANFGAFHHTLAVLRGGGTLCLQDSRAGGLTAMCGAILANGVTQMRFAPSLFRTVAALPQAAAALRKLTAIRFSGEPLLRADIERVRARCAPGCRVQNLYGSTESMNFLWSDDTMGWPDGAVVPNGRIYPAAEFQVLDAQGQPAGAGETGELIISAQWHALGDWRDGKLDTSRFPPDPRGAGRRLYATGDLVRLLENGEILVLGRKDRLIKINGQRVSLPEIEAALLAMPGCAQAAVLPWQRGAKLSLVGFLAAEQNAALPENPGDFLAALLPRYMVPARFEILATLPLLAGGKVDAQALLAGLSLDNTAPAPGSPAGGLAESLAALWAEILEIPLPGPDMDFFAAGGDSLKALALLAMIDQRLGYRLADTALFEAPTLRALVALIERGAAGNDHQASLPASPVRRAAVQLRMIRHARGPSRGVVLGMPGLLGHDAQNGVIAANAFAQYDVWTFAADAGGETLLRHTAWLQCARDIAAQLVSGAAPRPRALFGFSMGGFLSWVVDRLLTGAGWQPTPIINFDGGPLHLATPGGVGQIDALLAPGAAPWPARMLLLHRAPPGAFALVNGAQARWSMAGVAVSSVPYATTGHLDLASPAAVAAADCAISVFLAGGAVPELGYETPRFASIGGQLFALLSAKTAPDPAVVRQLAGDNLPADGTCRLALLVLVLATAELEFALGFARRILATEPQHRAAAYAEIALLCTCGQNEQAAQRVQAWCARKPDERAMPNRLTRVPMPVPPWEAMPNLVLGSDAALDYAINLRLARGAYENGASK